MSHFASGVDSWSLPRNKVLTKDEQSLILNKAKETDPRLYVFLAIGINVGLRSCEIIHIKKQDLQDGQLIVTRRKKRVLKPQVIDIVPPLWAIVSEWSTMFDDYLFPGTAGACFINRSNGTREQVCRGNHMSKRVIQRGWELLIADLGLRMYGRGVHTLRHAAITNFYAKTRDLRATQMFAAHSSSQMTERYAHCLDMREKVHSMEAML